MQTLHPVPQLSRQAFFVILGISNYTLRSFWAISATYPLCNLETGLRGLILMAALTIRIAVCFTFYDILKLRNEENL